MTFDLHLRIVKLHTKEIVLLVIYYHCLQELFRLKLSSKHAKMTAARERIGRPTQFHAVPPEERAVDAQGNRLPWALEWAE